MALASFDDEIDGERLERLYGNSPAAHSKADDESEAIA